MKILFVCTGNSCRSPMAELYFNHMARQKGLDITAASAGIYANDGGPISRGAAAVMQELGIDTVFIICAGVLFLGGAAAAGIVCFQNKKFSQDKAC